MYIKQFMSRTPPLYSEPVASHSSTETILMSNQYLRLVSFAQ